MALLKGTAGAQLIDEEAELRSFTFELFADYFQFYLQDESAEAGLGDAWTKEACERMLAVAPGNVGVGTARNMDVPVEIEVHDHEPGADLDNWDQIVECDLDVRSGRIVVAGCTDYFPDADRIEVIPGSYRVRVSYGALNELSEDRLEGADRYRVQLWTGDPEGVRIVKQRHS